MSVGKWDPELFAAFKAAEGAQRRALLDRLLRENTPLVITLVEQLCGRGAPKKNDILKGGREGFRDIPFEDAMQAGRIAFCKAAEAFDPSRGRIAGYLKWKIRYELQQVVSFGQRLARVPRGREDEALHLTLVGEQEVLDRLGGHDEGGLVGTDEITPADLEAWERTGDWPESLEELRARRAPAALPPPPPSAPRVRTTVDVFLEEHVVFRASARTLATAIFGRLEALSWGGTPPKRALHLALVERGAAETRIRLPEVGPRRAYRGVALTAPTTKAREEVA